MVSLTTRIVARSDLLSCEVGEDGAVLLDPKAGVYLGFDGVAAVIWSRVKTPVTVGELCDAVLAEFEVERGRCEDEVRAFVEDLLRRDLVSQVDAPHAT